MDLHDDDRKTEEVRRFYAAAPFPNYRAGDDLAALRARAARSSFARMLDRAVAPEARVLDLGCGTGQMTLYLASGGRRRLVVGADLCRESLALAAQAAARFGLGDRARFVETDLRRPALAAGAFDVVLCWGVLHHTPDPRAALRGVVELARPGGVVVLGLYNTFARLPHRLRRLLYRASGGRLLLGDPVLRQRGRDPARRRAWLRDQYQHPLEQSFTLARVRRWLASEGVEYLRSYPSALVGEDTAARADGDRQPDGDGDGDGGGGGALFAPAADRWWPEEIAAQLSWMASLGHEGGLFGVIGRRGARQEGARTPASDRAAPGGSGRDAARGTGPPRFAARG
jgi:2-polyprenyl-3-methyl-5-hydroxy-6-metoxy-1,4-benzoquinol methylase